MRFAVSSIRKCCENSVIAFSQLRREHALYRFRIPLEYGPGNLRRQIALWTPTRITASPGFPGLQIFDSSCHCSLTVLSGRVSLTCRHCAT